MDNLPSVADDAAGDDRYKALKSGAEGDEPADEGGETVNDCIDRAVSAAQDGDWAAMGTALKEAFSDYGAK
jgi:hypothetical protein